MMLNDMYLAVLLVTAITLWCVVDSGFRLKRFYSKNRFIRHPRVTTLFMGLQMFALIAGGYSLWNPTRAALGLALPVVIVITAFGYGLLRQMIESDAKQKRTPTLTDEKPKREVQTQFVADDGKIMEIVDDEKPKRGGNSQGG